jgi:Tol biopolymer transport system component
VRLSPDGRRIAVSIGPSGEKSDIWVYDLARGALSKLTFQGDNNDPVWTPDGKRVTFRNVHEGKYTLAWVPADGSGFPETLAALDFAGSPESWSPDGKLLLYSMNRQGTMIRDLHLLPGPGAEAGGRKPRPFLQTPYSEFGGEFSPDGRWIAYVSSESQRAEVFVRPAGAGGAKWQVSTDGGQAPRWARDGHELFYRNGERLMAVALEPGSTFRAGAPRLLFQHRSLSSYGVSPDAKRFLMLQSGLAPDGAASAQVHLVFEWFEDLRRRVRGGR